MQFGVVDGDVLHLPEGIFGGNLGMVNLHILHVLEDIFAVALQSVHVDVVAEHERVSAVVQLQVADVQSVATPEHFVGIIHLHVFYLDVVHLTEHLGGVDDRVFHDQMVRIPQGRASAHSKIAVLDGEPVYVPERIIALEAAVRGHNVAALLDGRFAGRYGYVVQVDIMRGKQRSFASEYLVFNELHNSKSPFFAAKIHPFS